MRKLIWWLIAGMRGGENRARIIHLLNGRPYNANQIAKELDLDYKTVRHHLKVLKKNGIITTMGPRKYGQMYFLTEAMTKHYATFQNVWEQVTGED